MDDVLEVEVDSRGRVSLGRLRGENQRFQARRFEDGEIMLTPVVSVSARELAMLRNPQASRRLRHAIAQAEAGKLTVHPAGSFTQYIEEGEA